MERAESLIRKMFFLNTTFADCNCISDVYEPKNVFPNLEKLFEKNRQYNVQVMTAREGD